MSGTSTHAPAAVGRDDRPPTHDIHAVPRAEAERQHDPTPVLDALLRYRERDYLAFHTPGHKRGTGAARKLREALGAALDVDLCLMPGFEDSRQRGGYLPAAERLAADAWGTSRAFFLTNGSSGGLHTLAVALAPPGSVVVTPRNAHKALLGGLLFSGATPRYVEPEIDPEWGVPLNVPAERFASALAESPAAAAVFVSSPSYNGCCADVTGIVRSAGDTVVAVDQAWGAHLRFCDALPPDAVSQGADAFVTSIHKMLSGVSQASLIGAQGRRVDLERLAAIVRLFASTSMLVPILASIDAARSQMMTDGERLWSTAVELAETARARLSATPGVRCMGAEILARRSVSDFDRTRLTVSLAELGWAGYELEWELRRRYRIAVEAADALNIVMNVSHADTAQTTGRLVTALTDIAARGPLLRDDGRSDRGRKDRGGPHSARAALSLTLPPFSRLLMTPREAYFAASRAVPLRDCVGEVCAEMATPYPPGVPVIGPGEEITAELVAYLMEAGRRGLAIQGPQDPTLATLRVVAGESRAGPAR